MATKRKREPDLERTWITLYRGTDWDHRRIVGTCWHPAALLCVIALIEADCKLHRSDVSGYLALLGDLRREVVERALEAEREAPIGCPASE